MPPRERFDKELSGLTADLMDMASMVNGVIRKTSEALEENDMKQAHRIQEGDVVINRFERHIEQTCLSLIKRESPIASDLRLITAALKIITDLEHAAAQCADICEIIERSGTAPHLEPSEMLLPMMSLAEDQFANALSAYFDEDKERAQMVMKGDEPVNAMFTKCVNGVAKVISDQPTDAMAAVDTMMIAKYIERIGDHATNIAEWAMYLATGRHPKEALLDEN